MSPIEQRFWSKVDSSNVEGCWFWKGSLFKKGYGRFSVGGRTSNRRVAAHRFAWTSVYGPIASSVCVCHSCDMPACVNPGHLFLGSVLENNADRDAKRRQARGSRSGRAVITEKDVLFILAKARQGVPYTEIAKMVGLKHAKSVYDIVARKSWKHVEDVR